VEVGLTDAGSGLQAFRNVSHCDDVSCVTVSNTNVAYADPAGFSQASGGTVAFGPAVSFDTAYTVTVSLNESTGVLTWTIAGGTFGTGVSGTVDPTAYLAATPAWTAVAATPAQALAGPGFQSANIGTRAIDNSLNGGSSGRMTAQFDNVYVGLNNAAATLWDDFSGAGGMSGPVELLSSKWSSVGNRTMLPASWGGDQPGNLQQRVQYTNPSAGGSSSSVAASLGADPTTVNTLQTDLWFAKITGSTTAYVQGRFYNDGSPGSGAAPNINEQYSQVGDIMARASLNVPSGSSNTAIPSWLVMRCTGATGPCTAIGSGSLGFPVSLVGQHSLGVTFDPNAHTFTFSCDGTSVAVNPAATGSGMTTAAPYVKTANAPSREIGTFVNSSNNSMTIGDVRFNNVFIAP
jgi:hypothetical protein